MAATARHNPDSFASIPSRTAMKAPNPNSQVFPLSQPPEKRICTFMARDLSAARSKAATASSIS